MDVSHFSVYALAHVVPLVSKDVPHSLVYTEDSDALPVSPEIDLAIKEDHDWHLRYPNLRVRSMNVTVVEGYEPGKDLLSLPETDGFTTEWLEREGVLIISAIPGFDFTDNTLEDYGDSAVELVDVSEVLEKGEATAALKQFVPALRRVAFSSTTAGSQDRVMELSVMELLTAAVIAKISWTRVLNSPDPPEVHPTPVPATYFEKAPSTVVDPEVQVRHSRALARMLSTGLGLSPGSHFRELEHDGPKTAAFATQQIPSIQVRQRFISVVANCVCLSVCLSHFPSPRNAAYVCRSYTQTGG